MTRRTRLILAAVATALVVVGVIALVVGNRAQRDAPQPPPEAAGTYAVSPTASGSGPSSTKASPSSRHSTVGPAIKGPHLAASRPTRLQIPKIGVDASMLSLGLTKQHTLQVPPLSANSQPSWYHGSPAPGQIGPSIVLGHIDSAAYGPGVFFKLGALRPGDKIEITRADKTVAVFKVDGVVQYPKAHFPALTVYGNTDHAALRLITCGGTFDPSTSNYKDNIIAYASLVSSHKA